MRILSSDVNMQVQTQQQLKHKVSSQSSFEFKSFLFQTPTNSENEVKVPLTKDKAVMNEEKDLPIRDLVNKFIIEILLSRFLGKEDKEIKLFPNNECCCKCNEDDFKQKEVSKPPAVIQTTVRFDSETTYEYYKKKSINFNTSATIKTQDKDIDINLNLSYTQEFYESYKEKISFESTMFLDPLVINYDLSSNYFDSISDELSFEFDINSDGEKDTIPMLKDGSGFLALDKNSNGKIDNGNELFGPRTNKGFEELKEYDTDGNNWIDENDTIFNDLRIWSKDEKGEDSLVTLANANIGAIYLADIASEFNYDKSINEGLAKLKRTSIFLTEDGKAGLVKGLDFAVS